MPSHRIDLVRLTEVDLASVTALLNEPRNARHMPLAGAFTAEDAAAWVAAKDGQWATSGCGPWAVLVDGAFAGWGGFQAEANGADFALVLQPAHWGLGEAIALQALDTGFRAFGLEAVTIALPYTRSPDRAVARLGFVPDGEVMYGEARFRQYRLTREVWAVSGGPGGPPDTPRPPVGSAPPTEHTGEDDDQDAGDRHHQQRRAQVGGF